MEYAENGDMFSYLRKSTMTEPQIRAWLLQILWAFRYMHALGVVHRDLKCENILLTANYNIRVADFGFARFVDVARNSSVSTVCGTMAYSAPELLSATRPYNPMGVDVWAIGVVLFLMANNVAPYRNKRKEDIYKKQVSPPGWHDKRTKRKRRKQKKGGGEIKLASGKRSRTKWTITGKAKKLFYVQVPI